MIKRKFEEGYDYMDSTHLSSILHISNDNAYKILEKLYSKGYLAKEKERPDWSKKRHVVYKIKD